MTLPPNLLAGLMLILGLWTMSPVSASSTGDLTPQDATQGSLWLRSEPTPNYLPAPTLKTSVDMNITGMLARVQVRQTFSNPGQYWAEGIYVFPLPEHAAVDHLRMHIGKRVIEGVIQERQQAKKIYETAKQTGKRASLVEQERANIFTSSLANIAPGESITVEIEYQQTVQFADGEFHLRFPMVVAPRYIPGKTPGAEQQIESFSGTGWAQATTQVVDAARITPPVHHPDSGLINPVSLDILLEAGVPLTEVRSTYHTIEKQQPIPGNYRIQLAGGTVPADRDFELAWKPQAASTPNAAWFVQQKDQQQYGLLMLLPPRHNAVEQTIGRDVVFVIDTSGSMHGDSIIQARKALLMALNRLTEHDRFNVIQFNHTTGKLFAEVKSATPANLAIAYHFVRNLDANGGTEMLPALEMALQQQQEHRGIRQVIFLTDGSVGNERELFQVIRKQLANSRLFTIGIGSAPNSYFMRKAANYGRGTFTYIGKVTEVMDKMAALFTKLEQPALTDIRIELPAGTILNMLPQRIPDLYMGEPMLLAFRGDKLPEWLNLRGRIGDQIWKSKVTLNGGQQSTSLSSEWGRRKIDELMTRLHDAQRDEIKKGIRDELVSTALNHHLVSKYTSLVAVDVTPVRERNELLKQHAMQTNLPTGWSYEHVFGIPQTATDAQFRLLTGLSLLLLVLIGYHVLRRQAC